jgi:hypothetical protein
MSFIQQDYSNISVPEDCTFSSSVQKTFLGTVGTGDVNISNSSKITVLDGLFKRNLNSYLQAARTSTNQALTVTGSNNIIFNSVTNNEGNIALNTTSGIITLPRAGWYLLNCTIAVSASSANYLTALSFILSGSPQTKTLVSGGFQATATRPLILHFTDVFKFTVPNGTITPQVITNLGTGSFLFATGTTPSFLSVMEIF